MDISELSSRWTPEFVHAELVHAYRRRVHDGHRVVIHAGALEPMGQSNAKRSVVSEVVEILGTTHAVYKYLLIDVSARAG